MLIRTCQKLGILFREPKHQDEEIKSQNIVFLRRGNWQRSYNQREENFNFPGESQTLL